MQLTEKDKISFIKNKICREDDDQIVDWNRLAILVYELFERVEKLEKKSDTLMGSIFQLENK